MMLYYSVHYPKLEKEALLIDAMRQIGKVIKNLPGCLFDNAFQDVNLSTLMAITEPPPAEAPLFLRRGGSRRSFQADWVAG